MSSLKTTPLHEAHIHAGARMVDFSGWSMPVHYGSQVEEHHAVRQHAGVFDVSHMLVIDVEGGKAQFFLQRLLANDVARLKSVGRALYSCMLRPDGGVIDDLIVYRRDQGYRLVVNAGTRDKDLAWMQQVAGEMYEGPDLAIRPRPELAIIAIQGPGARDACLPLLPQDLARAAVELKPFNAAESGVWFLARTGYTGEDGFELILPAAEVHHVWTRLLEAGVRPAGLGARDTLRLEAGMNLYGNEMDEHVTPLESGLEWTVAWEPQDRDFIGRAALEARKASGGLRCLVGLVLEERGVLRAHMPVHAGPVGSGETTSGSFSPTLGVSIALARVPAGVGEHVLVEIRGKQLSARVVKPPFVRHGKSLI